MAIIYSEVMVSKKKYLDEILISYIFILGMSKNKRKPSRNWETDMKRKRQDMPIDQ